MFKIYVGNLDYRAEAEDVMRLFQRFGPIEDISLAVDKETGKKRGFAIVMLRDELRGRLAIESLAGTKLRGRTLVINEAITKKKGAKPPSFRELRSGPLGPRAMGLQPRRRGSRNPRRSFGGPGGSSGGSSAGGPGGGDAGRPGGPRPPRPGGEGGSSPRR